MSAVDPQQEVSDLKRKLRLIKNKLRNPTETNIRQAISMIDDTFATEEVHNNCSRFGIKCSPSTPPLFAASGYAFNFPASPMSFQPTTNEPPRPQPTFANAYVQTEDPGFKTRSIQTMETGESCSFSNSVLFNTTQTNLQQAIELLTETKSSLTDRGKKRKHDGASYRSKAPPPISTALCSPAQYSKPLVTPTARPSGSVVQMQRVQKVSESKPSTPNALMSSEKFAIGDGIIGKYTPSREKNFDPASADKRNKIKDIGFACKHCPFNGDSEMSLFYHNCILSEQAESPYVCCNTPYKHRGYYTRHREQKHKKPTSRSLRGN